MVKVSVKNRRISGKEGVREIVGGQFERPGNRESQLCRGKVKKGGLSEISMS